MKNESGLEPRGVAVLIKPYEPERAKGMIELPDFVKGKMAMVNQRAVVVAVGPNAWYDEREARALPGDRVLVTQFAGMMAEGPLDGQQYRLVNDRDIFCRIVEEA